MDEELERFKRDIDLRQYAASTGYELDKRDSWRGSSVMRRGGDKVVIKRNAGNSHYVYFSVRDDADNGSIIDFIQNREKVSLGEVRKKLRSWVGGAVSPALPLFPALDPVTKDRLAVETTYRRMEDAGRHPYLEKERRIPAVVLSSPRFEGRVRIDARGNAVFPHFDQDGLAGYEIKNTWFTSFSPGGEKALWVSRAMPDDNRLVFAESAIDALSYAALFPEERTRYASIGGKPNPKQPGLIKAAIARMPDGSGIVAAFDADEDGRKLAELVRLIVESVNGETGSKVQFEERLPQGYSDWNDQLRGIPLNPLTSPLPIAQIK